MKEELQNVLHLLRMEKKEEATLFQQMIRETPLNQRVEQGSTWYPLNVESSGYGLGEYPFIVVSRTKNLGKPHKFRAGQPVVLFSQLAREMGSAADSAEVTGVVHYVNRDNMKIIFHRDDMPDWVGGGRTGVELAFDERSYREMEKAMEIVIKAEGTRLAELRDILYGVKKPSYWPSHDKGQIAYLNDAQSEAVYHVLGANDVAIVHGPPGTGKTTTLVQAIAMICRSEKPVLVCAPSNAAVDLLTEKLAEEKLNVVRTGNISRVDESLIAHTLEHQITNRPEMQEVKKMMIEASQLRRKADKFKRTFGPKEREEKRQLRDEAKQIVAHARMLEDYVIKKIVNEADVICATLVGSTDSYIEHIQFGTVIIDEAAQALEPATWIPIMKANRVVFAGDPFQLPPTVKSFDAARAGFNITLMEKCIKRLPELRLLNVQYRMHEDIMGFSNKKFYRGELKAADHVKYRTIDLGGGAIENAVEFIDTAGCGFEEKQNPETRSYFNPDEYAVLWKHLDNLLHYAGIAGSKPQIGIIAPYKEQVIYMQEHTPKDFDHFPDADIEINTVDAFQGQESDVIYISLVRSNEKGEIGFLGDIRRMNVAMTRAKMKLVVIGDSATLGGHPFYADFLSYCEKHGAYQSAWEYM